MNDLISNLSFFQKEYLGLLLNFNNCVNSSTFSPKTICSLLDEVKFFWLKRLKLIDYDLNFITKEKECCLLCGAIYLDVSQYEHFYFKSLGDFHIISDPLLKMENIFRKQPEVPSTAIQYFKKVFLDTISLLSGYGSEFFILPVQEIYKENNFEKEKNLNLFLWKFISELFDDESLNEDEFYKRYQTFEQIDESLGPDKQQYIIFNDTNDLGIPLREKMKEYRKTQSNISTVIDELSEPEYFIFSIYCNISQVVDIFLVCSTLNCYPYIRNSVTFHYLSLIMNIFIEDEYYNNMIQKSLIHYLFRKTIAESEFIESNFQKFSEGILEANFLKRILNRVDLLGISVLDLGPEKISRVIRDEFLNFQKPVENKMEPSK